MRHLGYFWPNYKHYFGTVSPLSMGKCSWSSFLQKTLVFRSKTYNSQILPKLDMGRTEFGEQRSTIVDGGPVIMAKIFGVFGTKTCSFIKENRTKNGHLVFHTVLCSKHDEKLGNWERKTLRQVVGCGIVRFWSIFVCQMLELARNHMVLLLGK